LLPPPHHIVHSLADEVHQCPAGVVWSVVLECVAVVCGVVEVAAWLGSELVTPLERL
jgi:hypothetical protein